MNNDDTSVGSFSDDSLFQSNSSFGYSSNSSSDDSISTVESGTDVVGVRQRWTTRFGVYVGGMVNLKMNKIIIIILKND